MAHAFRASRLSPGNLLFPTVIEVNDRHVTRIKPSFITRIEESISIRQVSSVTIKRGVMWAEIIIHSSGGTAPLLSSGHTNADAERLKNLIEDYQATLLQTGTADSRLLRACPRCAELVKAAARVCRFCQHELPIELTEEADANDEPLSGEWRFS
jgi:Uncharacterised protein family UPF0547